MKQTSLFRFFSLLLAFSSLGFSSAMAETNAKNIVLIFVDDLGYPDLTSYGSDLYQTPHIDALAEEGLRYTDAYASAPVCSPTRAALQTGQASARLHITNFFGAKAPANTRRIVPEWSRNLSPDAPNVGRLLREAGYNVAWFGKWHITGGAQSYGYMAGEQKWLYNKGQSEEDPKGCLHLTQQTLDFIKEAGDKPFYVGISHYAVHGPMRFNAKTKEKYETIVKSDAKQQNAEYAAMVEALDDSVGVLMKGLKELGKLDNTWIIFASDNGGELNFTNNAPLREGKGTLYEGGIRVPFIVRLPQTAPHSGTVVDHLSITTDLLPTFLDIAGIADQIPAETDGVSLLDSWKTGKAPQRDTLAWHYPHYHAGRPASALRKGDYKIIEFLEDERVELYNLRKDIGESQDLANAEPEKAKELTQELHQWREKVGAQMMEINPDFDPSQPEAQRIKNPKKPKKKKGNNKNKQKKNKEG